MLWCGSALDCTSQSPLWVKSTHMRRNRPCPLYPRKQTCAAHKPMSVKTDLINYLAFTFDALARFFGPEPRM